MQTALFAAVLRQLQDTIKNAEIQRKTHLCEKTAQVRFCVFRSAVGSCRSRSKCTKAGREVWRAEERKIQAIYLKIALSVVLSL